MSTHNKTSSPVAAELSNPLVRERMVHVALSILRDGTEAEDAAQDAVEQALRGSDSFRGQSLVSTWLHRVVVNAALIRVRRRKRAAERAPASDQTRQDGLFESLEDRSPTPEALLQNIDKQHRLHTAVTQLPRPYRAVVELCVFEELTLSDVARSLGITSQSVRTRMFRARAQLRERMAV